MESLRDFSFQNLGRNSDLSSNLQDHLPKLERSKPGIVYIMIGTNDILAHWSAWTLFYYRKVKGLEHPEEASAFAKRVSGFALAVKDKTGADVRLITLPLLGEKPEGWAFHKTSEWSEALRCVARESGFVLVDFHREMTARISIPALQGRVFDGIFYAVEAAIRQMFGIFSVEKTLRSDLRWTLDGIHLSRSSAEVLSELIEKDLLKK